MSAAQLGVLNVTIVGTDLPGRAFCEPDGRPLTDVRVGVQVRDQPERLVPGDAAEARWEVELKATVDADGLLDFRGPAVHGKRGERFLYLTWGNVDGDGAFHMFRRAKLMLNEIGDRLLRSALAGDGAVVATVQLTDGRGGPRCARVDPPAITWTAGPGRG